MKAIAKRLIVALVLCVNVSWFAYAQPVTMETKLSAPGTLEIVVNPVPADYTGMTGRGKISVLPTYNPNSTANWQVDLRSCDLSSLDVTSRLSDLLFADFDSVTKWPASLPAGFDPAKIMDLGKDPGLGLRALHAGGLTGKGVGIAIIDQALLTNHVEYRDQLRSYEEVHWIKNSGAQMHGTAVASIAVGKNVGVAPGADLYFIASWPGDYDADMHFNYNLEYFAQAIDRVIQINHELPANRKIRVISISLGLVPAMKGYESVMAAIKQAEAENITTLYVGSENCLGAGRTPMSDPNVESSFGPGVYWLNRKTTGRSLLLPMDSRSTASPTGVDDYAFYRTGGLSWTVPYLAGLFALACQVDGSITFDRFWQLANQTADAVLHNGSKAGVIVNPARLYEAIKKE